MTNYKFIWLLYKIIINVSASKGLSIFIQHVLNKKDYTLRINGNKIILRRNSSDLEVFKEIFADKQYLYALNLLEKAETIMDLGANVGLSIVNFKTRYPDAKIIAVEPDCDNYNSCIQNTSFFENVFVEQKAIWYQSQSLELFDNGKGEYALSVISNGGLRSLVDGISMKDLFEKYNVETIDLLKIDIEGAEFNLFSAGENEWLKKVDCIIIELHDWIKSGCSEAFFKAISPYKFKVLHFLHNYIVFFDHEREEAKMQ